MTLENEAIVVYNHLLSPIGEGSRIKGVSWVGIQDAWVIPGRDAGMGDPGEGCRMHG